MTDQNGPVKIVRRFEPVPLTEEQQVKLAASRRSYQMYGRASSKIPEQRLRNFKGDDGLWRYATPKLRRTIFNRDGGICQYCREPVAYKDANIDHVIPWPTGRTVESNLVLSCQPCNKRKGSRFTS